MHSVLGRGRGLIGAIVGVFALVMTAGAPVPAQAQTAQGVLGGAIVGGAIGGLATRKGAGVAVGAGIGAVVGGALSAAEQDRRRRAYNRRARHRAYKRRQYRRGGYAPRPVVQADPLVRDIQGSLQYLGFQPGPVDGIYGSRTARAISAYQAQNGMPVTGQPSPPLLAHMSQQIARLQSPPPGGAPAPGYAPPGGPPAPGYAAPGGTPAPGYTPPPPSGPGQGTPNGHGTLNGPGGTGNPPPSGQGGTSYNWGSPNYTPPPSDYSQAPQPQPQPTP